MELNNNNSDDLFDSINNLRLNSYNEGAIEGETQGKTAAFLEGFKTGLRTSIQINGELGYYSGICEQYTKHHQPAATPTSSEIRSYNLSNQIRELVSRIDISNAQSDTLMNDLNHIRDKFKQFCSLTNFKSDKITPASTASPTAASIRSQATRLNF